jgi:hypothetical protein
VKAWKYCAPHCTTHQQQQAKLNRISCCCSSSSWLRVFQQEWPNSHKNTYNRQRGKSHSQTICDGFLTSRPKGLQAKARARAICCCYADHCPRICPSCCLYADQPGSNEKLVLHMNNSRDTVETAIVSYDPTAAAPAAAGAGAGKAAAAAGGSNPIQQPSEHAALVTVKPCSKRAQVEASE